MKKWLLSFTVCCFMIIPVISAADSKSEEKAVLEGGRKSIPQGNIKTADNLYKAWQDVQSGADKAVISDIRTEAEFDSGHIKGSNNVDSGHAYTASDKWPEQNIEVLE